MRIEEINREKLERTSREELFSLRLRFIQLWNKYFKGNEKDIVGTLKRPELLEKHRILIREMKKRSLKVVVNEDIDKASVKKIMGIDVPSLGDLVVIPDYVSVGGSFIQDPETADDVDVIIRVDKSDKDEGLELKLNRLIQKQVNKGGHFIYNKTGAHSSYLPLFDLVLRAKDKTEKIEVKEDVIQKKTIDFKLILVGTGASGSLRKDRCLLIKYKEDNILIDAGPNIEEDEFTDLTEILICDPESSFMKDARRIGQKFSLIPQVKEIEKGELSITPFEVKHTKHKTYGYEIKIRKKTIVYAPEFFKLPKSRIKGADLAILEGSTWDKPITFIGKIGGHAAILKSFEKVEELEVPVIFTNIGSLTEKNLEEAQELEINIAYDGQVITLGSEYFEKFEISKPETTENYHRIPVRECKITATITLSEEKGIKALYCGKIGKIATFLFDVDKWTMADAKVWVKDYREKAEIFKCECVDCGHKIESVVHCVDIKCPECGGQMRRVGRPGSGKPEEHSEKETPRKTKEARHKRDQCMECEEPPFYECLWAEGIGHAWFCKKHFKEWATNGDGKNEIISVKEIKDGTAVMKFGDNKNPNIWDELKKEFNKKPSKGKKKTQKSIAKLKFLKVNKKEHIVGGIVYPANETDAQGDRANAAEIWKALKNFMIKKGSIKILHKGEARDIPVIECFQSEEDTHKGGRGVDHLIKKGDWYLSVYLGKVLDVWEDVLSHKLNGFSIAGMARSK
jgi:predicted RNA-binding Zn-ribbon protein involved in translation (DUF1610 family)